MDNFSDRLKKLRSSLGLSQTQFAKKAGVTKQSQINYEANKRLPNVEYLKKLSEMGVNINILISGNEIFSQQLDCLNNDDEAYDFIPIYDIWASIDRNIDPFSQPVRSHLAFRKQWLQEHVYEAKDLCAIFAKGNSMEPTIGDCTMLVINRTYNKPVDGKIFVIRQESNIFIKRLQLLLDGGLLLISDNQTYFPIQLSCSDLQSIEIIGQIVHISRDV